MSIFGNILTAPQVEQAVAGVLALWFPTYLQDVELQLGRTRGAIPPPKQYAPKATLETLGDEQLPFCVVVSPGLAEAPWHDGEGMYTARFSVGLGVICSSQTQAQSEELAKIYAATARTVILQKRDSTDIITAVDWIDETYDDLQINDARTLGVAIVELVVQVENVVSKYGGPADPIEPDPDTQPGTNWPLFQTAEVTVVKEED